MRASSSETQNNIRAVVRRVQDAWNAAFNHGDAAAVAALYTDDAIVLPPSHVIIKGAAAIRDYWLGLIGAGLKDHGTEMIDAEADSGLAWATGRWGATGPEEVGKSERFGGTVVMVMRRQGDGSWKLCLHTWN